MKDISHRTTNIVLADDDEDDYLFLNLQLNSHASPVTLTCFKLA
jgi:hypothetical protein